MIRLRHLAAVNPTTPSFDRLPNEALVTFVPLEAVWPSGLDVSRQRPKGDVDVGYTRFIEGDIVVPKITPTFQANRTTIACGLDGGVAAGTTELHVVRVGPKAEPRYVRYLLSSRPFLHGGEAEMIGVAGQKRVPDAWLRNLPVPVTDIRQQRAIADYLDTETARIDALITKKRSLQAVLERRWRAQVRHELAAAGSQWGWIPLKRLVECLDHRRVPLNSEERAVRQGAVPYFGSSGVVDYIDDWLFDEELVLLGEDGAQLGDPDCEISFVVRTRCWVNNHAHVLRPVGADADFLALHLSCVDRPLLLSGATREKLTQEDMGQLPVPHLALSEQRALGNRLTTQRDHVRSATSALQRQIVLLQERRQALITAAVTGEFPIAGAAA